TLFFGAGAIYVATHLKKISLLSGMARQMPWTFGAFSVAALSMIGVPPVCGFVSKWYLVNGALDAGQIPLMLALLISTLLNTYYFGQIIYKGFFGAPAPGINLEEYREAPLCMVIPLCITAAISVFLGLYPQVFQGFVNALGG
ncbi:MAG: proton-conducting transporter membrane subunit, partial [Desulfonatronovibrionaceae bacterium]